MKKCDRESCKILRGRAVEGRDLIQNTDIIYCAGIAEWVYGLGCRREFSLKYRNQYEVRGLGTMGIMAR